MNIALKEAGETQYWLELLFKGEIISGKEFDSIYPEITEIAKILAASVKTVKQSLKK